MVRILEQYGKSGRKTLYITVGENSILRVPLGDTVLDPRVYIFRWFGKIFLPKGYPDSVSDDYAAYQKWDTIQAFCSTISGTLCTHAVLQGIGVGNENATAYSATISWTFKEACGHLGRIIFSCRKGSQLDVDSKKWRLRADFFNDLAMGIEIYMLPKDPFIATFVLGCSTILRAIVGVAGGATRSALTQHHAIRGNLADVTSKDSAQETCVNLIASFLGLGLLKLIERKPLLLHSIFILVTLLHLYANLKAVKAICLRTFNESRYLIALEEFFRSGRMLTPQEANKLERVTIGQTVSVSLKIRLGLSLKHLVNEHRQQSDAVENILSSFDPNEHFIIAKGTKYLDVYLHFDTRPQDVLKAYFFAVSYLQDSNQVKEKFWEVKSKWQKFMNVAQQEGWLTDQHLLMVDEYRIDWSQTEQYHGF